MVSREDLLACVAPGGSCSCGRPAVILYTGRNFTWPRCGFCPGTTSNFGVVITAKPMERHHRALLRLLGDEQAFISAVRLGYRPAAENFERNGKRVDQLLGVPIEIELWEVAP